MSSATLGGRVIACLEARNATELADLVTRHGGIPYPAPCLREVHEPDAAETRRAVRLICGDKIDVVAFLTGVGVETIVECARRLERQSDLKDGLSNKHVAVRGPKALNAVRRLGVAVHLVAPEPFTSVCLLESMAREWDLRDQSVLVQLYGAPAPAFTDGLRQLGATVVEVSPYRWERPLDEDAVVRMIEDIGAGWIDVLAATNAAQVDHLFDIARDRGYESELNRALGLPRLRIAAQGVVCASAFQRRGIGVHVIPPRASMGAMIMEIARGVAPPAVRSESIAPDAGSVVAMLFGGKVSAEDVSGVVSELSTEATVALLSGKGRFAERLAEQCAVKRGMAVHIVAPARNGLHPADALVRRADRVVIVTASKLEGSAGALVQLAARYAKPVRVFSTPSGIEPAGRE